MVRNGFEHPLARTGSGCLALAQRVLACLLLAVPAASAEDRPAGWDKPLHGISLTYPVGWSAAYEDDVPQEVQTADCDTPECEITQETCEVVVPDSPLEPGSFMNSAWLMPLTIGHEEMIEDVLSISGEGATITRPPTPLGIGSRFWYVTETMAGGRYKSAIRAVTEVEGRYVLVSCWTCDRAEDRFDFAHRILETVTVRP